MTDLSQHGRDGFPRGSLDEQLDADSLVEENGSCQSEIQWQKDGIGFFGRSIRRPRAYRDGSVDTVRQMEGRVYNNQTNDHEPVE
jgi:hypothetical protein